MIKVKQPFRFNAEGEYSGDLRSRVSDRLLIG